MGKKYFCPRAEAEENKRKYLEVETKRTEATYDKIINTMKKISERMDGWILDLDRYGDVNEEKEDVLVSYAAVTSIPASIKRLRAGSESVGVVVPEKDKRVDVLMAEITEKFKKLAAASGLTEEEIRERYERRKASEKK